MAELGMALVEAAHREALRECQPPPPRRAPAIPGYPGLPELAAYRSTTFNELFVTLTHCVRQSILLEARLEAGVSDRPLPDAFPAPRAPRNEPECSTSPTPDRLEGHPRLACEHLEDDFAHELGRPAPEILAGIARKLEAAAESGLSPGHASNADPQGARAATLQATPPPRRQAKPPPLSVVERRVRPANRSPPLTTPPDYPPSGRPEPRLA